MGELRNGDVVLVEQSQGLVSEAIRLGARIRYGFASPHARYVHAAIVYDASEPSAVRIVEATAARGVQEAFLEKYDAYDVISMDVPNADWKQVKAFLDEVIKARTGYDYLTHVGIFLYTVTGTRLCVQTAGTAICSGLVCDALTRAGKIFERPPYACTPADISFQFQPGGAARSRRRRRRRRSIV